jgi:hypothetical protein
MLKNSVGVSAVSGVEFVFFRILYPDATGSKLASEDFSTA